MTEKKVLLLGISLKALVGEVVLTNGLGRQIRVYVLFLSTVSLAIFFFFLKYVFPWFHLLIVIVTKVSLIEGNNIMPKQ